MKRFRKLIGRPKTNGHWENPRKSIGQRSRIVRDGTHTCWEAVGPARKIWGKLGPEIKEYVENACKYGSGLSVDIYMVGKTEDVAAPMIFICSMDFNARKEVRKAIKASGIMKNYPTIGLGDASEPPDLLAQVDIEWAFPPNSGTDSERMVLTTPMDKPFGRRLFIPTKEGSWQRRATAGPILYINGNIYQLTVGHAFLEVGEFAPPQTRPSDLDDCDFDGQSDCEDDDPTSGLELSYPANPELDGSAIGNGVETRLHGISSSTLKHTPLIVARQPSLDSGVNFLPENSSAGSSQPQQKLSVVIPKLSALGKLELLSDTSRNESLDYALVKLEGEYCEGINEVPCGLNGSQRFLQVRQPAEDGPRDVNVITITASSGFLTGRFCATASYMRFPNQRVLQELYSVRLEGKLEDGDCGSGVVDQSTGHMYGHVVAGTVSTGRAYIVSVEHIFMDIKEKMGGEVTLVAPEIIREQMVKENLKLSTILKSNGSLRGEPLRVVEFASEKYFSQLAQPAQSQRDEKGSVRTNPRGRASKQQKIPKRSKSPRSSALHQEASTLRSNISTSAVDIKGKLKENNDTGKQKKAEKLDFAKQIFALPSDIQVQIIAFLNVPDIFNLRGASKTWHKLLSTNEMPISRAFLELNPVPSFAASLYPLPGAPEMNLSYVCGIWHRLSVVSRLSTLMADWITKTIFLRQARLCHRLIPLLFTSFHFFETYRHLHLRHLIENDHKLLPEGSKTNPVECEIMNMYDNETLLQVHQIFPFLISCLDQKLRPPSYWGRIERSFRGYGRDPPPEYVHVGILCIGGLREMLRFSEIENYEARRTAVDDWYSFLAQKPINYGLQSRRLLMPLGRKLLKQVPSSTASESSANKTSASGSMLSLPDSGDNHDSSKSTRSGKHVLGGAMPLLSAKHARLLLPDLPDLKQIWIPTAEALLVARQAVGRRQDIKKNGQPLHELVLEGFTNADKLYYGRAVDSTDQEDVLIGWRDLLDDYGE